MAPSLCQVPCFVKLLWNYFPKVETEGPELPIAWNSLMGDGKHAVLRRSAMFAGEYVFSGTEPTN